MTPEVPLPTGTLTFLFTDIEGSTRLWEQHPAIMPEVLARHDQILTEVIEQYGGHVFKTVGDAFCAAFPVALDAVASARLMQERLAQEPWKGLGHVKIRIALHSGSTEERNQDYFGPVLNRVARLLGVTYAGQVLVSRATQALVAHALPPPLVLRDLGSHRLKDLTNPEQIYQLCAPGLSDDFPPLRSLSPQVTNLPIQTTSFIGREDEMAEVKRLVDTARLVTVAGSGGCGKTRLCLQVAADLIEQFPDGVWLTELAPLSDPEQVSRAVAAALGIREVPERDTMATIIEAVHSRKLLLVLDNCEHVRDAAAVLTHGLLRNCPDLHILTSSREGLGVPGERMYRIPSLAVPDLNVPIAAEDAASYGAVRLFVERARFARPDFALTDQNAPALVHICSRLDGIPLALELAAARVRMMSVEQIDARLDDRFRLLTGGSRMAESRQQTLRGMVDWSYKLLNPGEAALFQRLAAFTGGCTLEACEAVGVGGEIEAWEVLDLLGALVDKSLVVYQEGDAPRYRLLETIRQYAHDKLQESHDSAECAQRHRDFFLAWTQAQSARVTTEEPATIYREVDADYENVRCALEWSEARDATAVLTIANALTRYWYERGLLTEGRRWLRTSLTASGVKDGLRARSLNSAGIFAMTQGDLDEAQSVYEESLRLNLVLGDRERIAASYNNLGLLAHARHDFDAMERYHQEGLATYRDTGDTLGIIVTLSNLGFAGMETKDFHKARERFEEALELARPTGNAVQTATILQNLGAAAVRLNDNYFAQTCLTDAITMHIEAGAPNTVSVANALLELSGIAIQQGNSITSVRMVAALQAVLNRIDAQFPESQQNEYSDIVAKLKVQIEPQRYAALWAEGLALSPEAILQLVEESRES